MDDISVTASDDKKNCNQVQPESSSSLSESNKDIIPASFLENGSNVTASGNDDESSNSSLLLPKSLCHDQTLSVSVTRPQKIGDGVAAHVVYTVSHSTQLPHFAGQGGSVTHRFSDFLNLWERLKERYAREGIVLPPRPEKSILGTAKVKVGSASGGNHDQSLAEDEFVERRRGQLERLLVYCCQHPRLRLDADLRDFLEKPFALGGASSVGSVLKALTAAIGNSVADRLEETDQWFANLLRQLQTHEAVLRPLFAALSRLARERICYARQSRQLAGSLARLVAAEGSAECQSKRLTVAFDRLADTQASIGNLQACQAECELSELCEQLRHHLAMLESVRAAALERQRLRRAVAEAEVTLAKRREERGRLERTGSTERLAACDSLIEQAEKQLDQCRAEFQAASAVIKAECERLDLQLGHELRSAALCTLEHQLIQQQLVVDAWAAFLPDAIRILPPVSSAAAVSKDKLDNDRLDV